jgi:hypothetical protein
MKTLPPSQISGNHATFTEANGSPHLRSPRRSYLLPLRGSSAGFKYVTVHGPMLVNCSIVSPFIQP